MAIRLSRWSRAYIVLTVIVVVVMVVREYLLIVDGQNALYTLIVSNCRSGGASATAVEACLSTAWATAHSGEIWTPLAITALVWAVVMLLMYGAMRAALGVLRWVSRGH